MAKAESRPHPTNLWTDPDLQRLPGDVRRMLDYLMTGPDVSAAGVTLVEDGVIAARIGFHHLTIDESINILATKGEVYVDWETREVWPVRWARFHKFEKQIAVAALEKAMREIKSSQIKRLISGKIQSNQRYSHQHQHQHQHQRQHQRQHQQQPQHDRPTATTSEGVGVGVGGQDQDQDQSQTTIPAPGRGSCGSAALVVDQEGEGPKSGNSRRSNTGKSFIKEEVAFSDDFLLFWKAYPAGKGNQREAWAVWQALDADPAAIMKGLAQWLRSENWQREAGRYVPNPVKFLREQRWQSPPSSAAFGVSDKERFRRQHEKYKGMTLGQIRAMKREAEGVTA